MSDLAFADATLILLGHGSTVNQTSAETVFQHASELRARKMFSEVREAFWKQEPHITSVLAGLNAPRVFIVPLFVSEGHFAEVVIPRALGFAGSSGSPLDRIQQHGPQRLVYCKPIGTHALMTEVLLGRARDTVKQFPFPRAPAPADTTLFLAGHGTDANENSRLPMEQQARLIASQRVYADVHAVFMEEEPRISQCYQLAQTKNMVVVPFFMSQGMHVQEDIPVLLGEPPRLVKQRLERHQATWRNPTERHQKLVWYTPCVGTDPRVAEVILARVEEMAGH